MQRCSKEQLIFRDKKLITKNGITIFLTKEEKSFEKLSRQLQNIEVKLFKANLLYMEKNITPHKVFTWAQGSIPKTNEVQALAYLKFKDTDKWLDLYIPSSQVALCILKDIVTKTIHRAFKNPEQLQKQIAALNYAKALETIENYKVKQVSQIKMATILTYIGWRHYLAVASRTSSSDISSSFSKESEKMILDTIYNIIDTINSKSYFSTNLTAEFRSALTLEDFEAGLVTRKIKKIALPYIFELFE